jgi:hypothetical protein
MSNRIGEILNMPIGSNSSGKNKTLELQNWTLPSESGDKWYQVDSNGLPIEQWFWDGNYWRSFNIYKAFCLENPTTTLDMPLSIELDEDLFLLDLTVNFRPTGTNDINRHWKLHIFRIDTNNVWTWLGMATTSQFISNVYNSASLVLNQHLDVSATNTKGFLCQAERVSNAGRIFFSAVLNYQKVKNV